MWRLSRVSHGRSLVAWLTVPVIQTLGWTSLPCFPRVSYWRRNGERMPRNLEQAMTVRNLAEYLNVTEKTIYRLVQRGEIPGFKVAGAWRFQRADIDVWIDDQKRASVSQKR